LRASALLTNPRLGAVCGFALLGIVLVSACAVSPRSTGHDPAQDAALFEVLDRYMDGLNVLDLEAHVATYHFPHYRHASGRIVVWASAEEALPVLRMPKEARLSKLREMLEPDWVRSEWTRRDVVQRSPDKVHVATTFVRLRADGSAIKAFESLYVLTRERDAAGELRWGIKGRSSFAP